MFWLMNSSLEMLSHVNLAEEGVLRLLFAAVYLMSRKVGSDNEVSAAARYSPIHVFIVLAVWKIVSLAHSAGIPWLLIHLGMLGTGFLSFIGLWKS